MSMKLPDVYCPYCGSTQVRSTEPDNLEGVTAVSKTATCGKCDESYVVEYEAAYVAYPNEADEWERIPLTSSEE